MTEGKQLILTSMCPFQDLAGKLRIDELFGVVASDVSDGGRLLVFAASS